MSLITIVDEIMILVKHRSFMNQVLYYFKFVATIAITITFLVFFKMLAPLMGMDYLLSFNNFSLHAIVPILAVVDFFLFDTGINLDYPKPLIGGAMPLYYVIFVYVGVPLNFRYGPDLKFPYFFLDYEKNGFFFEKGFGAVMWIIVMLIGIFAICFLFAVIMHMRQKRIHHD